MFRMYARCEEKTVYSFHFKSNTASYNFKSLIAVFEPSRTLVAPAIRELVSPATRNHVNPIRFQRFITSTEAA
jgi:hypothetical protein